MGEEYSIHVSSTNPSIQDKISVDEPKAVFSSSTYRIPDDIVKEIKEKYPEIQEVKELKKHKSIKPQIFYMTNDKISNELTKNLSNDLVIGNTDITKYNVGTAKKPVLTLVSIDIDNNDENIKYVGREPLTCFDKFVQDSVTSLIIAGNYILTPPMIYGVMTGKGKVKTDVETQKRISESMEKLRRTKLYIDRSEETGKEKDILDNYLLIYDRRYVKLNGQDLEAYIILRIPLLYEYANFKNQIINTPIKMLDVPINNTEEVLILKTYIIQRIEQMKSRKDKLRNIMLYETLYKQVSKENGSKTEKSRTRKNINKILKYLKDEKYIKGYQDVKKGNSIYSIKLSV